MLARRPECVKVCLFSLRDDALLEPAVERDEYERIRRVFISAQTGAGIDLLREAIGEFAENEHVMQPGAQLSSDDEDVRFKTPDQHTNL